MTCRVRYGVDQSPFFKCRSKKAVADLLGFDLSRVEQLLHVSNYKVFFNKDKRLIQYPLGELGAIHKRIADLLSRLAIPSYVRSIKGESYVSNAGAHSGSVPVVKTDISRFYPNTNFGAIFRLFRDTFGCSSDVSYLLARLAAFDGKHLPTGSYLSGALAFLAYKPMFEEIRELAVAHDCVMTRAGIVVPLIALRVPKPLVSVSGACRPRLCENALIA